MSSMVRESSAGQKTYDRRGYFLGKTQSLRAQDPQQEDRETPARHHPLQETLVNKNGECEHIRDERTDNLDRERSTC